MNTLSPRASAHRQRLLGLALLAALQAALDLTPAGAAAAAAGTLPQYSLQLLGNLPAAPGSVAVPEVLGLNARGQVVGRTAYAGGALPQFSATQWSTTGAPAELGRLPSNWNWASAQDINDGGLVAGSVAGSGFSYTAVRWSAAGGLLDLGAAAGAINSEAMAINTIWQTVGTAVRGSTSEAALWQADGSFVNLGHLPRTGNVGVHSVATGITDNGLVAGFTRYQTADALAWVWSPVGGAHALQQAAPGSLDMAADLNAAGWVVGETRAAGNGPAQAVAWDAAGRLVPLQGAGYASSSARDINGAGWVVGDGDLGGQARAWLWSADTGMLPLDTLIAGLGGFRVHSAGAINEFGQIAGWGYDELSGQTRAFVLSPMAAVPEPGTGLMLLAGAALLVGRRRPRWLGLAAVLPGLALAQPAALPHYTVQLLPAQAAPAGLSASEGPRALNNRGLVAGFTQWLQGGSVVGTQASMWSVGGARQLDGGGPGQSLAIGLNDGGLAAGYLIAPNGHTTAARWNADGSRLDLGADLAGNSLGLGINTIWQVVGTAYVDSGGSQAVLWQPDGSRVDIGHLGRAGETDVRSLGIDINDNGTVLGSSSYGTSRAEQGWRWSPVGGMTPLQQAGPASLDRPRAINASGWAAGYGYADVTQYNDPRALLWNPAGELVAMEAHGFTQTVATGINNAGMVVGEGLLGSAGTGWVWTADSGMVDLSTLVVGRPGFRVAGATAINDLGQITGLGWDTLTGDSGVFLLTPTAVPEPGPAALLAAGLAVLAWRRRRATSP